MQEVTIIGQVLDCPTEIIFNGRGTLQFTVRAENSPKDKTGSSFDFRIITTNLALKGKVVPGSEIYVSGLMSICREAGDTVVSVQGLVFSILSRSRSIDDIKIDMVTRYIPLQSI